MSEMSRDTLPVQIARPVLYFLFHHLRLFGWIPALAAAGYTSPLKTLSVVAAYAAVHRRLWWQRGVHRVLGMGASKRSTAINPYKDQYDSNQRYLGCFHPHGILVDAVHNYVAQHNFGAFDPDYPVGSAHPTEVNRWACCFAPVIQHVPVHQEMYRQLCSDASSAAVKGWWEKRMPDGSRIDPVIAPGGFAESCFADAADTEKEYLYLKGRTGFIKLAIESGADICPLYSFNASNMYYNFPWLRGARARLSQKIFIGLSWPFGRWGSMMPLTDECSVMFFPPFKTSSYSVHQVAEAHADYCAHIKKYFDIHKADHGQKDCTLEFVGKDFVDLDPVANAFRQLRSRL